MFTQITLKNFRTHKLTKIELSPITLLIGNNNSGKSNLLAGIQHFSNLVKRGRLENSDEEKKIYAEDISNYKYRLTPEPEPIGISISWNNIDFEITYDLDLYDCPSYGFTCCIEKIKIKSPDFSIEEELSSGSLKSSERTNLILLRQKIKDSNSLSGVGVLSSLKFFEEFEDIFTYHFQPFFLKQSSQINLDRNEFNSLGFYKNPPVIKTTGEEFQKLVRYIKENEEKIYTRFVALLRRFEINFQGVRYDEFQKKLLWSFDLGQKGKVEEFFPDSVSDGFMKAAAISLLASFDRPPTLILLEEIENGINPGNIQELMRWLWQMTSPNSEGLTTQFIITSHSPSVLREFYNHLDHVYTVRLQKRDRTSDVRNLNTSLDTLVGIGTVEGEIIEDETTGKRIVEIPKYQLAELWYSGTIG
jgi:AAA15 family ATPase/GTPase